jgi:methionyl-tRNA formyltransferase
VRSREGRYLLRTNLTAHEPDALWTFYIQLTEVEQAFKEIKQSGHPADLPQDRGAHLTPGGAARADGPAKPVPWRAAGSKALACRAVKVLLLTHLFNSLAQRLFVELRECGHEVTVEFDIADSVTEEAVALAAPDVVIAPFMKRRIPESVWSRRLCLVVHPGPPGDGGPSALDHALLNGEREWGVTVLQATAEVDAGPVWAWAPFLMREASKGEIYRGEVVEAAVRAVLDALARWRPGASGPEPAPELPARRGRWQPLVRAAERSIEWQCDDAATVLRKVRSADGSPGALAALFGTRCRLFDAHAATPAALARREPQRWRVPSRGFATPPAWPRAARSGA